MAACDELMADDFSEHAAAPSAVGGPGTIHGGGGHEAIYYGPGAVLTV